MIIDKYTYEVKLLSPNIYFTIFANNNTKKYEFKIIKKNRSGEIIKSKLIFETDSKKEVSVFISAFTHGAVYSSPHYSFEDDENGK